MNIKISSSIFKLKDAFDKLINLYYPQRSTKGKMGREKTVAEFDDKRIALEIYNLVNGLF